MRLGASTAWRMELPEAKWRHLRIRLWSGAGLTFLIPAEVRQFRPLLSGYRGSPPRDAPPLASLRP